MLAGCKFHGHRVRDRQREDVLCIVRGAGRIAVAPPGEDLVLVGALPVDYAAELGSLDTGLLAQLAPRRFLERLARFLASCHRLPEAGKVGTLKQEDAQVGCVHEDESRNGELVAVAPARAHATNTQNGLCRSCQYSAASPRISDSVSQSVRYALP